jgi:hypothetical protein
MAAKAEKEIHCTKKNAAGVNPAARFALSVALS